MILRMDIDQAEATINSLATTQQHIGDTLQTLTMAVQQIEAAWEGAAQRHFLDVWHTWLSQTQSQLNELEDLRQGVAQERQQYIDADTTSSFG